MKGLYVHVPFCAKKCHYCDFVIAAGVPEEARGVFFDALEREALHRAPLASDVRFDTLYLGGGTPSALSIAGMERLFSILRTHFRWNDGAEITCEANPEDVSSEKANHWKKLGIGRVSLGAQSFHDETLQKLNRTHGAGAIERAFHALREAGIRNISLDLILSLPGEGWEKANTSLEKLAALGPEHVSIYELSVEEKTVFGEMRRKGQLAVPEEDEQLEILSKARAFLKKNGYRHYELLNYARLGFESRHNLLYWANADTLGLGPGAYSHWQGRRWRFAPGYREYLDKAAARDWTPAEDETLDAAKKQIESFLLALRLSEGADARLFAPVAERFRSEIEALTGKGLLQEQSGRIRLTDRGQFLAETVFAELSC